MRIDAMVNGRELVRLLRQVGWWLASDEGAKGHGVGRDASEPEGAVKDRARLGLNVERVAHTDVMRPNAVGDHEGRSNWGRARDREPHPRLGKAAPGAGGGFAVFGLLDVE